MRELPSDPHSYFEHRVLPSVDFPLKPSYNFVEVQFILGMNRATVYRLAKSGKLVIVQTGHRGFRVYLEELRRYFSKYDEKNLVHKVS